MEDILNKIAYLLATIASGGAQVDEETLLKRADSYSKECSEKSKAAKPHVKTTRFVPPTVEEVREYCKERGNGIDAESFIAHYEANGWMQGKSPIKSWKACVTTWEKSRGFKRQAPADNAPGLFGKDTTPSTFYMNEYGEIGTVQ